MGVAVILYTVYLDFEIRGHFEGRKWQLPARVYARPMELFAGADLTAEDLNNELKSLRYRPVRNASETGTYSRNGNEFELITRPFRFWDASEPSHHVRIRFAESGIQSIEGLEGAGDIPLLRMDPVHIASIYPKQNEDRILVKLDEVPELLTRGLIAVEDRKFLQHRGIDFTAIFRAMYANLRAGRTVQGGSTITQQLVKNFFLSNKRSLWRKFNEALMAPLLEWHYDKEEILETYINEVYLGQDGLRSIHGFGLASQFYFNRDLSQLKSYQLALLIGLVKGPSYYDPRRYPDRALKRRNLVLEVLAQQGVITPSQARDDQARPLNVSKEVPSGITAYPAFLDLVKRQLRRDYHEEDLSSAGLRIFTTLDPLVQQQADSVLKRYTAMLDRRTNKDQTPLQGAYIITDTGTGEVLAVAGDRNPGYAGFNRALDAVRPIGSLVKPAVYIAALAGTRYTLASMLDDEPFSLKIDDQVWAPKNYDKLNHGQVPLYLALANSYNVSTARLGMENGLDKSVAALQKLGIRRPIREYPSLLLGAIALSPLEVAQMYQTLAASGFHTPLRSIRSIVDAEGKPLQRYPLAVTQVFSAEDSFLITTAMSLVNRIGTGKELVNLLPPGLVTAGKTGTTDDLRDSWYAGFSEDYLAVVWLGNDDNHTTRLTGSTGAMQIWAKIMKDIHARSLSRIPTDQIEYAWIDPASGKLSARSCQDAIELPFKTGTVPTESASCRGGVINWIERIFK